MIMETQSTIDHDVTATGATEERISLAGALLGYGAVLVWNDIADEGREKFYEWHDKEHMPERLGIPGFHRGRRFAKPGHSPEWLTIYEADDLSVVTSPAYLARLNAPTPATVSTLPYFQNTSRAVCRVVHSIGSSTGGHILAMRLSVPTAQADAMCRYLCGEAFPRAIVLNGIVACHLFAADHSASFVSTAESNTRKFDVPSWVVFCEATNPAAADQAKRLLEDSALQAMGVVIRNDAAVYGLEICRLSLPLNNL
jgi:hypothetical protein